MSVSSNTPIIVGVGQCTNRLDAADYQALSAVELAVHASREAFADALSLEKLKPFLDTIVTTRTFEDSIPARAQPFGKSNNFPRSIAQRLGLVPRTAVWDRAGGDTPQRLINEFCEKVAAGEARMVLLAGAENISSARALVAAGKTADWSEAVEGEVEDRGMGLKGMFTMHTRIHKLAGAPPSYGLLENARRGRLGMTREAYADEMGRLFSPFSAVAAEHPCAAFSVQRYSVADLTTVTERNRMIADPYPQRLVARDQVNQGAALLITTVGLARELGIPEDKWVFLHGYSDLAERDLLERQDLSQSPAAQMASKAALGAAGIGVDKVRWFDFYSCFPIAVFNVACDGLGLAADDKRGLTVTGGHPFFGGPGNNYSTHAVATMVEKLRRSPGQYGFIGANGGVLSKYSVGIYSTQPKNWKTFDSRVLQEEIDNLPAPELCMEPEGPGTIETYTTVYEKGQPAYSIVVGRLEKNGARFLATTQDDDRDTVGRMLEVDPLGSRIFVTSTAHGNRFTFSEQRLAQLFPKCPPVFREQYEFCLVERKGHLLEVTINRPEARNSLHPMANDELAAIFDAYEADTDLWVAIITGAGTEAFCAGADLKYNASGKSSWLPKTGFGGLTNRVRSKPVIAAVNGFAMGGGTEISLACDIIVADATAQFALSEVRVGLFAGAGGVVRLPRQIPVKIANELILTGRKFSAEIALQWGMVNRIEAAGQALPGARTLAAEILEASPTSVRLSMKAMRDAGKWASADEAMQYRDPKLIDELIASDDYFEGPSAFAQKRKPVWKNR
ncbi:enoyl-CoA hydratase-related protein [Noviherbaspirillum sedimenti]|nr:enoyl-CoA hydratase-related protein [Noviherbaspirillum sedimenti]